MEKAKQYNGRNYDCARANCQRICNNLRQFSFKSFAPLILKEYCKIVGESRPLSAFFPTHADFFYRNAFLLMKLSNPPSFKVIRALIASQSMFET